MVFIRSESPSTALLRELGEGDALFCLELYHGLNRWVACDLPTQRTYTRRHLQPRLSLILDPQGMRLLQKVFEGACAQAVMA